MTDDHRPTTTSDQKLEQILIHLERMDRRDRLRTWGSVAKAVVVFLPILLLLGGAWYAVTHIDDVVRRIAEESAKQAAKYTQEQSNNVLDQLKGLLPKRTN